MFAALCASASVCSPQSTSPFLSPCSPTSRPPSHPPRAPLAPHLHRLDFKVFPTFYAECAVLCCVACGLVRAVWWGAGLASCEVLLRVLSSDGAHGAAGVEATTTLLAFVIPLCGILGVLLRWPVLVAMVRARRTATGGGGWDTQKEWWGARPNGQRAARALAGRGCGRRRAACLARRPPPVPPVSLCSDFQMVTQSARFPPPPRSPCGAACVGLTALLCLPLLAVLGPERRVWRVLRGGRRRGVVRVPSRCGEWLRSCAQTPPPPPPQALLPCCETTPVSLACPLFGRSRVVCFCGQRCACDHGCAEALGASMAASEGWALDGPASGAPVSAPCDPGVVHRLHINLFLSAVGATAHVRFGPRTSLHFTSGLATPTRAMLCACVWAARGPLCSLAP